MVVLYVGRVAIVSLLLLMDTALGSKENPQQPRMYTYYVRQTWPHVDQRTSSSFPIGYGIGGVGFLPKGGLLGVGDLGYYGGGSLGGYGGGDFLGGGGHYGGYGGFGGGLQKIHSGSGYSKGQSDVGEENQAAGFQAGAGHKGQAALQNSQGYSGAQNAQKQNQQTSGYFGNEGGEKKKYEKGGAYEGGSNYGQTGKQFNGLMYVSET
jgi:hypothetical protein